LKEKEIHPDLMISSPAKRAISTCRKMGEILRYEPGHIAEEKKLYHASEDDMLHVIKKLNDKHDTVMVFGHNPGLTDFVNALAETKWVTDNIPTCGVVAFALNLTTWRDLEFGTGKLDFYDYPKNSND
jgi:phosphohistidine phosphatase